jgi:hypothetical protein
VADGAYSGEMTGARAEGLLRQVMAEVETA